MLNIQKNIPLAPYTTFKIGGPAKFFTEVKNEDEIVEALKYAEENNLKYFILAGGSNILISDKGFNGLVIKLQATSYKPQATSIQCVAGLPLSQAVKLAADRSLTGLEWAAGIPGTIGGAARGNAGAFGGCMADVAEKVKVIIQDELSGAAGQIPNKFETFHKLQLKTYKHQDCKFSYRNSVFKEKQNIIIYSVVLKLKKGNPKDIKEKTREILKKRKENQPRFPSAGSFFKNPTVSCKEIIKKFESDAGMKMKDDKIPAGWLIEEAGLNGKKIGGAQVSEERGNFIINAGGATAEEVIILASIIKQKIRTSFNIQLLEEVQLVGF